MSAPSHWSLLFGPLPTVLLVIGAMAAGFLVIRPDRRWAGRVLPLVIALASTATAVIACVINGRRRSFPDPLPVAVLIWVAVILSGMGRVWRACVFEEVAESRSSPCRDRRHGRRGESGQPILRLLFLGSGSHRTSPYSGASAAVVHRNGMAHGSNSLSYMSTWSGNRYWFSEDRTTAIAYRLTATVTLTTADPIGPLAHRQDALRGFANFGLGPHHHPSAYNHPPLMRAGSSTRSRPGLRIDSRAGHLASLKEALSGATCAALLICSTSVAVRGLGISLTPIWTDLFCPPKTQASPTHSKYCRFCSSRAYLQRWDNS